MSMLAPTEVPMWSGALVGIIHPRLGRATLNSLLLGWEVFLGFSGKLKFMLFTSSSEALIRS